MKVMSFEGSPEEFKAVSHLFRGGDAVDNPESAAIISSSKATEGAQVRSSITEAVAKDALTRLPISDSQRALLDLLLAVGRTGILWTDVSAKLSLTKPQLAGVRGALGRRVANTPGWPAGRDLLDWEWDADGSDWRYMFPAEVASAWSKVR